MNLNQKQIDALLNISEYEQTHDPKDFSLGWSWSDVRVPPATLNNLLLKGLLEEKFHSNSSSVVHPKYRYLTNCINSKPLSQMAMVRTMLTILVY